MKKIDNKKRKINKTYSLTVEGECEKYYFNHLKDLINQSGINKFQCCYNPSIQVGRNPYSHAKGNRFNEIDFFHIQDIEDGLDSYQESKFTKLLDDIDRAKEFVNYRLGYSNFSFDLWIILHKKMINFEIPHRSKYLKYINEAYDTHFFNMDEYKKEDNFKYILSQITLEDVYTAIENAKIIRNNNDSSNSVSQNQKRINYKNYVYYRKNPDLDIQYVVEDIIDECIGKKKK